MDKFAAKASLTGIKELYLIILALGVTEALVNIPPADCNFSYFSYLALLVGFLATVFRFILESMILLEHVALNSAEYWSKQTFFTTVLCLLSGVCLYLMGHNLAKFDQFIIYTVALLVLDSVLLAISHNPCGKGGIWFSIEKSISILTWHKVFPKHHPQQKEGATEGEVMISSTHCQWIRSNVFLALLLILILAQWYHDMVVGACPLATVNTVGEFFYWIFFLPQRLWLFQWLASAILLLFALWDLTVNYHYYFGRPPRRD